jgi:hypothetical protein
VTKNKSINKKNRFLKQFKNLKIYGIFRTVCKIPDRCCFETELRGEPSPFFEQIFGIIVVDIFKDINFAVNCKQVKNY